MRLDILVNDRPALTARMAVARYRQLYGITERAVRQAIWRSEVPSIDPPPIHSRIPLYDQEAMDAAMAEKYA